VALYFAHDGAQLHLLLRALQAPVHHVLPKLGVHLDRIDEEGEKRQIKHMRFISTVSDCFRHHFSVGSMSLESIIKMTRSEPASSDYSQPTADRSDELALAPPLLLLSPIFFSSSGQASGGQPSAINFPYAMRKSRKKAASDDAYSWAMGAKRGSCLRAKSVGSIISRPSPALAYCRGPDHCRGAHLKSMCRNQRESDFFIKKNGMIARVRTLLVNKQENLVCLQAA